PPAAAPVPAAGGGAGGAPPTRPPPPPPDQSIYAFRGADVNGILDFPTAFPHTDGTPAGVAVLTTSRRSGDALLAATRLLTRRMPLTRLPADKVRAHRELAAVREGGAVEAYTYPTSSAELDNIADVPRRAHLEDGVPWHDMAVLVRAGSRTIPAVRRALTSAGVPLEIDGADVPLRHEPAVAPLLTALRAVATPIADGDADGDGDADADGDGVADADEDGAVAAGTGDGDVDVDVEGGGPDTSGDVPEHTTAISPLDTETALTLLTSPLGGMDAADLRRLGRALRDEERAAGNRLPPPSDLLIARAVAEPERLVVHDPGYARRARELGLLLARTRAVLDGGGTAEDALWELWNGTYWPQRLENAVLRGGAAGRNADRDLDAVCALFDTAARAEERTGGRGALNFIEEIEAQDIAADTLSARETRPDAVRLMTAHRSKGLEWGLVVVAGVQEGLWPDLRRRGSLLEADRIGRDGLAEPLTPGAVLAEERR
ncbi:3'-5' exonuclease, partial [Streptomyces sp. NPDC058953]|uniref:3'-5' exonuclease n=1 Tax=Streptomyces sp. NPDC058953 TaxID=3346676 RepID=UPI0036B2DB2D